MKAIRVHEPGGPEVMQWEDVPDPAPGPKQVVVRVRAVGVNPVETYIRAGQQGYNPPRPYTPGTDAAGTIAAVGEGVSAWGIGDRVFTSGSLSGTYAEQALCESFQVHRLPGETTFPEGAALGVPYATAYRALFQRGQAQAGETVLVHGASGGVGIAAVQFARAAGMTVIATAGSGEALRLVKAEGAQHALDHHMPEHWQQALALTGQRGVDVILEMVAHVNLGNDLPLLAPGGRVVVIGSRGPVEINPRELMRKEADIRGLLLFNATPKETEAIYAAITAGLENGSLHPVIARELPLAEAPRAHQVLMDPEHKAHGKIVLTA